MVANTADTGFAICFCPLMQVRMAAPIDEMVDIVFNH